MKKFLSIFFGVCLFSFFVVSAQSNCCTTKSKCNPKVCCPAEQATCCSSSTGKLDDKAADSETSFTKQTNELENQALMAEDAKQTNVETMVSNQSPQ